MGSRLDSPSYSVCVHPDMTHEPQQPDEHASTARTESICLEPEPVYRETTCLYIKETLVRHANLLITLESRALACSKHLDLHSKKLQEYKKVIDKLQAIKPSVEQAINELQQDILRKAQIQEKINVGNRKLFHDLSDKWKTLAECQEKIRAECDSMKETIDQLVEANNESRSRAQSYEMRFAVLCRAIHLKPPDPHASLI